LDEFALGIVYYNSNGGSNSSYTTNNFTSDAANKQQFAVQFQTNALGFSIPNQNYQNFTQTIQKVFSSATCNSTMCSLGASCATYQQELADY